jgi:hypothetical protein
MVFRYVLHENVDAYHRLGWLWSAAVSDHACLMVWLCSCTVREPLRGGHEDGVLVSGDVGAQS